MNQRDIHLEMLYQYLIQGDKFGPAMRKVGAWSDSYSETPIRLKETKKYNKFMDKKVKVLSAELERLMSSMREQNLTDEDYQVKVNAYEKLTKIKLLLEGEATEITVNIVKDKTTDELMKLAYGENEGDEKPSESGTSEEGTSEEDTDTVPSV